MKQILIQLTDHEFKAARGIARALGLSTEKYCGRIVSRAVRPELPDERPVDAAKLPRQFAARRAADAAARAKAGGNSNAD